MKYKMLALILALTVVSWAQTATQTSPSSPQQSTVPADKAKCACCDKMAAGDTKEAHSCCAHHDIQAKDGKETASCCGGTDAKSCMRNDQDKTASCSKDSCGKDKTATACCNGTCDKNGGKSCCSGKKETTARNCCQKELHG
jgi:hypothetical protein